MPSSTGLAPIVKNPDEGFSLLVHRLPYPPNKGDKVRSYHLLRHLARQHRGLPFGTFVDDPDDWQHLPEVRRLCEDAASGRPQAQHRQNSPACAAC